jgi:iron complex outermembrane recepter protein
LIDGTPNTNTAIKVLTGETLSDGVEVDVASHPIKGLDISAGYSYNYARYTKTVNSSGSNKEGETLINNPKHTANATVFYSFNDKLFNGLKLGASIFYVGDRMGGYNNTVNQTQSYSRLIPVNGYTTIDVTAGYSFKKLSVFGKLSNITNTLNWNVHENYSINPIAPTQFVVTLSYKL